MGRLIAIASGKGGVGKSSVSVNISAELGNRNHKVLLIDLDSGMRCLDVMLGVSDRLVFDLNDILSGAKTLDEVLLHPANRENVDFIPAPLSGMIDKDLFGSFISTVYDKYDFIILDFPAGGVGPLYEALPKYCEGLVVCNADSVSIRDAATVGRDLMKLGLMSVRLILNRVDFDFMIKGVTENIDGVIDGSGIRLIGIVPQSLELYYSNCKGVAIKRGCRAQKAFDRITSRLLGYDIPLPKFRKI